MSDNTNKGELLQKIVQLQSERNELTATVEALTKELLVSKELAMRLAKQSGILAAVSMQLKTFCKNLVSGNIPEFHKAEAIRIALSYEDDLIEQHLRDVRAEAVCNFIEFMYNSKDCQLCSNSLDVASKYAENLKGGKP